MKNTHVTIGCPNCKREWILDNAPNMKNYSNDLVCGCGVEFTVTMGEIPIIRRKK